MRGIRKIARWIAKVGRRMLGLKHTYGVYYADGMEYEYLASKPLKIVVAPEHIKYAVVKAYDVPGMYGEVVKLDFCHHVRFLIVTGFDIIK